MHLMADLAHKNDFTIKPSPLHTTPRWECVVSRGGATLCDFELKLIYNVQCLNQTPCSRISPRTCTYINSPA